MTSSKWEKRAAFVLLYSFFFCIEKKKKFKCSFCKLSLLNVCISIAYVFMERKCHTE